MLELYLYTRTTCFGQIVTIFRSLRALIYNMQHMCQNTRYIIYYITYESSQGPEDGHKLTETCPSIQV